MWMKETVLVDEAHEWRARWFRLKFDFPPNSFTPDAETAPLSASMPNLPTISIPNRVNFHDLAPTVRRNPVGKCIYCGATEFTPRSGRKLSEEHVVSEGLGGSLVLPEASCESCANKTKRIEGAVLRTLLWAPRRRLKIRGKNRKRNEKLYPVTAIVNDRDVVMHLPLDDHPTVLFFLVLNVPGILCGRKVGESGIQGVWAQELGQSINKILQRGVSTFASATMDTVRFAQLLAKIAHGFAVAELGLDGFSPMLPEFILRTFGQKENWPNCYHVVGGDPRDYAADNALHVLGLGMISANGIIYLVVAIRLFANLGAPVFHVVVGEVNQEQQVRIAALEKARVRTHDKTPAPSE